MRPRIFVLRDLSCRLSRGATEGKSRGRTNFFSSRRPGRVQSVEARASPCRTPPMTAGETRRDMMTNTVLVSRFRTASYWISTGIIALAFGSGGVAYLAGGEEQLRG